MRTLRELADEYGIDDVTSALDGLERKDVFRGNSSLMKKLNKMEEDFMGSSGEYEDVYGNTGDEDHALEKAWDDDENVNRLWGERKEFYEDNLDKLKLSERTMKELLKDMGIREARIAEKIAMSMTAGKAKHYFDLRIEYDDDSQSLAEELDIEEMEQAVSKVVSKAVGRNKVTIQPG